jgi:hypothetical protein
MRRVAALLRRMRALRKDESGVALLEFALSLPILLLMSLTGAELTNFITTRMRVSQIALHLADNAARVGSGSLLAAKTVTETDINDLFIGANLQSGELALRTNGRVILSDLEVDAAHSGKFKIVRQRCYGLKTSYVSKYGVQGTDNLTGMGTTGRLATAPTGGATMYVEVYYDYTPLVKSSLSPSSTLYEAASMMVRDTRDLTQFYNTANATVATC